MTRVSAQSADPPDSAGPVAETAVSPAAGGGTIVVPNPSGPIERFMSALIRKLSWSRLSNPKVAIGVSGAGLLLGMLVAATAPNAATLPIRLPLSHLLPSLGYGLTPDIISLGTLYAGDVLACLGLAGMLWAHSQGWRPDPRHLLAVSAAIIGVMVLLTPAGSSDTASYAAYGRIAVQGSNPYTVTPLAFGDTAYTHVVGSVWQNQPSVYGPIATWIQAFAAWIGGANPATTILILMIINGAVFIGIGYLLLKTSDDPVRATLFWAANPVLIQQLVSGGHLDTLVAAASICAIQVARRATSNWGDVLTGVMLGIAGGLKANAALIALGLAWPLLRRHEWKRTALIAATALATVAAEYSYYGLSALKPLFGGLKLIALPSPWRVIQAVVQVVAGPPAGNAMTTVITYLWPILMVVFAWLIYQRISSDQPSEIVAPFALSFAWILVAPWVLAWYTALAWVTLTQVPRNRMTRWLAIVTVVLALTRSIG